MRVRTRFAPSPTGYLHIGGLRTALYAYLWAKKNGGDFILRIEDTDRNRLVEDACEIIYRTLKDTGLVYDEGPDVGGDYGPYIQSERKQLYIDTAKELVERGAAYYCFCTKERLQKLHEDAGGAAVKYDKHCLSLSKEEVERRIAAGEEYVIRQNIGTEGTAEYDDLVYGHISVPLADMEDQILLKSDGMPTYNLANVVDDHYMKISHVIRGMEYLSSTPKYNMLYDALGWERPVYIHLPPVMKDKTRKLSKRYGDASYEDFIEKGYLKEAVINYIALLGWNPGDNREIFTLEELTEAFDLKGISKSPSIFDNDKLTWMNAEYIRAMDNETFKEKAAPYIVSSVGEGFDLDIIAGLIKPRIETWNQIGEMIGFLKDLPEYDTSFFFNKKTKCTPEKSVDMLIAAREELERLGAFDVTSIHDSMIALAEKLEVKNGLLLWPLRIALSGQLVTPGGAIEIAALLGREESLRRIDKALSMLS
jgi:glutamyl-tRNA synthetase